MPSISRDPRRLAADCGEDTPQTHCRSTGAPADPGHGRITAAQHPRDAREGRYIGLNRCWCDSLTLKHSLRCFSVTDSRPRRSRVTPAIQGVRYDELVPMLLNEFQRQQKQMIAQDAAIQAQASEFREMKSQIAELASHDAKAAIHGVRWRRSESDWRHPSSKAR
jgi:hypothetical protein